MDSKQLTGTIDDIIFRNETNSFTVMEMTAEDKTDILDSSFVAVGFVLEVRKGDVLKLTGDWIEHNSYGRQFKISQYQKVMPTEEEAIIKYLSSGFVPGIGPKTARKIVNEFGKNTIAVIENHPEKLSLIKGLTNDKIEK
jgi:exodeoxyribonuclease V alpha subunit